MKDTRTGYDRQRVLQHEARKLSVLKLWAFKLWVNQITASLPTLP